MLTVICGPMFAGKSSELIRRIESLPKPLILKPDIDDRYDAGAISTHNGKRANAVVIPVIGPVPDSSSYESLAVDEAQFFSRSVVEEVLEFSRTKPTVVAGLDLTSNAEPFGEMPTLLAFADVVIKLTSKCHLCGSLATRTTSRESVTGIGIGGAERYAPSCQRHHRRWR